MTNPAEYLDETDINRMHRQYRQIFGDDPGIWLTGSCPRCRQDVTFSLPLNHELIDTSDGEAETPDRLPCPKCELRVSLTEHPLPWEVQQ